MSYAEPDLPRAMTAALRAMTDRARLLGYRVQASALLTHERTGEQASVVFDRGEWRELKEDEGDA